MRRQLAPAVVLAAAFGLGAQTFDPTMPPSVPKVSGPVVESFGLRYIDVKIGDGAAAGPGQEYTVHYTGWLRNGSKFDSSVDRGTPFDFVQGRRGVIAGWEAGFEGMKVGGKRRLFLPYELAYGELGRPPAIPARSELIFDVELLAVKDAAPQPAAGADLNLPLHDLEDHIMSLAKAVPEEKYSWRPAAGVRSFQEVFLHIANGNRLLLNIAVHSPGGDALKKQLEEQRKSESAPATKEQVVAALAESFNAIHQAIDRARTATLAKPVDFFGTPATTNGVLIDLETHMAEHLGQAIAYSRMNGIVPPWSK
ncbi:MAG TPA: DinB family protein [Bryobacteraceae bacterium]|nr:DinB family protein [Bryobacteraceae bacterium]